jgi:hypothetical protein
MLRRLRAVLAFAALWAGAWGLVGFVLGLITWLRFAGERHPAYGLLMWGILSALPYLILGALCGGGFAALISRTERERTVGELSLQRTALWGGLGGALSVLGFGVLRGLIEGHMAGVAPLLAYAAMFGTVGALSAAASLATARTARLESSDEAPRLPAT